MESMNCPKCDLPLNADHVHRTYEEHDACRNRQVKARVSFYDALDQVTPPYVRERWKQIPDQKIFIPDTTMRLAEIFAASFYKNLPSSGEELRDILYVFGMMADHEVKRLCNQYAKIALDALSAKTTGEFTMPFPEVDADQQKRPKAV